jgi:EAL domain-containing protein (putative c-di-GMP-specific phosphodiesterase class I)/ActR/RegA family two-component response regulator
MSDEAHVLLVDDDYTLLRAYKNALNARGIAVDTAMDGLDAKARLDKGTFDVVVSDINMPGYGGLEFLRRVRERDLDVPVVLMTGKPSVDSSIRAVEYGVFRYLVKPVAPEALFDIIRLGTRLHRMARLKRQALEVVGVGGKWLGDRAALESRFANAVELMWMAFQPIVGWRNREVYGYEALLRTGEPTLTSPYDFIDAAERLGRLQELGRTIRGKVVEAMRRAPAEVKIFVNLHASDLNDDDLVDSCSHLSGIGHRVILEITERTSLDEVEDVPGRVKKLRELGFRIAIDDLGAGYAGLATFTQIDPEVAKLDMSLVRDIDVQPKKQSIVRAMVQLCAELGILVVAEGVETAGERDKLVELGCDLLQGYFFAVPERGFARPRW